MKLLFGLIFAVLMFSSCQQTSGKPFPWKPYSREAVADSVAEHKPVLIDFWAEWCPYCHDLDGELFSVPEVRAKLAEMTTLRVDVTNQDDPQVQKILQEYDIEGLPTIVFLNSKGREISAARLIGFVTPHDFDQAYALVKIFK